MELIRVLVVDDEEEVGRSIMRYFSFFPGFEEVEFIHATHFQEALNLIETLKPLIVIQDINLPDGNGLQLVRQVKKAYPAIQFVILTGASNLDRVMDAITYGAVDYVKKPLDMNVLARVLDGALDRCWRWRELFAQEYLAENPEWVAAPENGDELPEDWDELPG